VPVARLIAAIFSYPTDQSSISLQTYHALSVGPLLAKIKQEAAAKGLFFSLQTTTERHEF
jgi:hypothetical protein